MSREYKKVVCRICNLEFIIPKKSNQKVCSKRCPAMHVSYKCILCNKSARRPRCFGEGKFCSEYCRQEWYYSNGMFDLLPQGIHYPVNPKSSKRRSKILRGDPIDKEIVFDFFGWKCIVCMEEIDKSIAWPDPMSASLDHVIPLACGGTHTWDNVAPAHLLCNTNKEDSIDEEVFDRFKILYKKIVEQENFDVNGLTPEIFKVDSRHG